MALDIMIGRSLLSSLMTGKALAITLIFILAIIGVWVFISLLFRDLGKKLGVPHDWASMSWFSFTIPYLMANMARKPWWPVIAIIPVTLLLTLLQFVSLFFLILNSIISLAFAGYMIYLNWRICELRNRPGWWSILSIIATLLAVLFFVISAVSNSSGLVILAILLLIFGFVWQIIMWSILAWGR